MKINDYYYYLFKNINKILKYVFRLGNFQGKLSTKINNAESGSGLSEYVMNLFDASLTWDDIKWLKRLIKNFTI